MWHFKVLLTALSQRFYAVCVFAAAASLAGCGFALRGDYVVPYAGVFISAAPNSQIISTLKRELQATNKFEANAKVAQAQLNIVLEDRDKKILSLSGAGRVREFQLKTTVQFQLVEATGAVIIATNELSLTRRMSFDDTQVVSKQQEEALLFADMERDIAQQIMRRVTVASNLAKGDLSKSTPPVPVAAGTVKP
jgi:LPS-assembly lipoprotein